jgi:hypothetical protein
MVTLLVPLFVRAQVKSAVWPTPTLPDQIEDGLKLKVDALAGSARAVTRIRHAFRTMKNKNVLDWAIKRGRHDMPLLSGSDLTPTRVRIARYFRNTSEPY